MKKTGLYLFVQKTGLKTPFFGNQVKKNLCGRVGNETKMCESSW